MTENDFLQGQGQGQSSNDPVPPYYTKVSEGFRKGTPPALQCALFCGGGRRCPYESRAGFWPLESTALPPLYSHWVTEDVLAMARLNVPLIDQGILQQFNKMGIKSVINLQVPGEHSSCSPTPLHSSGFSYDPTQLMDNGIYFYNYAWRDYGETSIGLILDMVKVLAFGVTLGKVAVHCHAGLGRTGVLISCYLVYSHRLRANEAMRFVRIRRPGSVQSRLQILSVQQFEQYILPHTTVFCNRDLLKDKKQAVDFTLAQGLKRQRFLAHGLEVKTLKYIPKILNVVCERFLRLCGQPSVLELAVEDSENRWRALEMAIIQTDGLDTDLDVSSNGTSSPISTLQNQTDLESPKMERAISAKACYSPEEIARGLLYDHVRMAEGLAKYFKQYRLELNQKGPGVWVRLAQERNLYVLSALMFFWLEHLRQPIIGPEELTTIVLQDDHKVTLKKLPLETAATLEYLMHFLANLALPEGSELRGRLLMRFGAALTHRIVYGKGGQVVHQGYHMVLERPPEKPKPRKLNEGTLSKLMTLFEDIIQEKLTIPAKDPNDTKEPSKKVENHQKQ